MRQKESLRGNRMRYPLGYLAAAAALALGAVVLTTWAAFASAATEMPGKPANAANGGVHARGSRVHLRGIGFVPDAS